MSTDIAIQATGARSRHGRGATAGHDETAGSTLFRKLIANVDRRRLAKDRIYSRLVSAITELLPDEEIASLVIYLAPSLALPSHAKTEGTGCVRVRTRETSHADHG